MNIVNHEENKFEKVVETNPLYTIFETKASISFKKGTEVQFSFDGGPEFRIIAVTEQQIGNNNDN